MPAIGYLQKQQDGTYVGRLQTLSISADLRMVRNTGKQKEEHPDFRLFSGRAEVGAGWIKNNKTDGSPYISVGLAAPEFGPSMIYANLGQAADQDDPDVLAIIWNPRRPKA